MKWQMTKEYTFRDGNRFHAIETNKKNVSIAWKCVAILKYMPFETFLANVFENKRNKQISI